MAVFLSMQVFTALALVGMLILPLNSFPWVLNGTLEAKVSLDRIQRFLELMDQDLEAYYALGNGKELGTLSRGHSGQRAEV